METIVRFTGTVILMFVTMTSIAQESDPRLEAIKLTNNLVFNLDFKSKGSIMGLNDVEGNVLFRENVLNDSPHSSFAIKNFGNGNYFLVVNSSNTPFSTIRLNGDKVEVFKSGGHSKPIFKKVDNMVYLNLMNLDQGDVTINVTDSQNRVVFKETVNNTIMVQKALNFEKAFEDSYAIVVKDGKDTYYENIILSGR